MAAPALGPAVCKSGSGMEPDQARAWTLRMNLWHICADSEASLAASMAPARLSAVLALQPSTDSCADATACAHSVVSAKPYCHVAVPVKLRGWACGVQQRISGDDAPQFNMLGDHSELHVRAFCGRAA